jgi:acyl-CoA synthetase (NDP forming)
MRMIGPNCMGVLNTDSAVSMNATFAPVMPPKGSAAFVSQSGALGLSVLDYAVEYGIGISQFVSVGNKPDVSGNDLLTAWENDPRVEIILMYVENFGNPKKFLEIASRITRTKPIVVLKSGRSIVGARAATSHTGALAASDAAVDALLAQAGVLRAASIEELFDMAMGFTPQPLPASRRTAVVTNSGGPGILAADAMEAYGLELVDLHPNTIEQIRPLFPEEASIRNPRHDRFCDTERLPACAAGIAGGSCNRFGSFHLRAAIRGKAGGRRGSNRRCCWQGPSQAGARRADGQGRTAAGKGGAA